MEPHGRLPKLLRFMLAGYIVFLPIQFEASSVLRLAPSDVFLALFLLFGAGRLRLVRGAWGPGVLGIAVIFATSTLVDVFRYGAVSWYALVNKDIGIFILLITFAVLTSAFSDWQMGRWMLRLYVLSVTFNTLAAIGAFMLWSRSGTAVPLMNYQHERLSGLLVDPNAYGGLVAVALSIHMITYFDGTALIRGRAGILAAFVLLVGLFLTFSRSSWIGFGMACLAALAFSPRAFGRMLVATAAFLLPGVAMLIMRTDLSEMVRMAKRPDQVQARLDQLNHAIPLVAANPIFGIGLGSFGERFNVIVHNTCLWMLTEFGLFGLSIFAMFFLSFVVKGVTAVRWTPSSQRPVVVALLCAHISMLGVSMGIEALYQRHWWMVMALLSGAYVIARRDVVTTDRFLSLPRAA